MVTGYLKRNLSWLTVPFNGVMRSYVDDGERTETTHAKIYWRYEDETDMVPQFLADAEVGFEAAVPFDSGGRDIRLFLISFTEFGDPTDKDFILAEQTVVDMSSTQGVFCLFDHFTSKTTTGTSEETLYIDQIDAGQLAVNGDKVTAEYAGEATNNGNSKTLAVTFGGTTAGSTIFTTEDPWKIFLTIMRASNTEVLVSIAFDRKGLDSDAAWDSITGLDLDATDYDIELKATTPTAAGDVTAQMAHGLFIPAASTHTDWLTDGGEGLTDGGDDLTDTE